MNMRGGLSGRTEVSRLCRPRWLRPRGAGDAPYRTSASPMALPPNDPNAVLQRAPNLSVQLVTGHEVHIRVRDRAFTYGEHALALLDAMATPKTVAEALAALKHRTSGVQSWIELSAALMAMKRDGILVDVDAAAPLPQGGVGFDGASIHSVMLNDRVRTARYLDGIRDTVRPGDVVVDIGTGTGVLAIAAAQAGAKHVYAVEVGDIAETARAMFERNGVADVITIIRGWSSQITLPERADVLVSETLGNSPLEEQIMEIMLDARKRLLKPGARIVPRRLRVYGLPVEIPPRILHRQAFPEKTLDTWQEWYGIDFDALRGATGRPAESFYVLPQKVRDWKVLSAPLLLADVDFETFQHTMLQNTAAAVATEAGTIDGVLLYFDVELSVASHLCTHPEEADPDNHWLHPVWILPEPIPVAVGDRFATTYNRRVPGNPNTVVVERRSAGAQRGT